MFEDIKLLYLQTIENKPYCYDLPSYWNAIGEQVASTSVLKGWARSSGSDLYKLQEVQNIMLLCNFIYKIKLWNTDSCQELMIDTTPLQHILGLKQIQVMNKRLNYVQPRTVFLNARELLENFEDFSEDEQAAYFTILSRELEHLQPHLQHQHFQIIVTPPSPPKSSAVRWSDQEDEYFCE